MKLFSASMLAGVAATLAVTAAVACTPMGAGKNATVDGSILVTHTCDSWYDNQIRVVPGTKHEKGDMYEVMTPYCENTVPGIELKLVGKIPEVEETYTYFNVGYPFLNEHQVMMGEHTWCGRINELQNAAGILDIGNLEVLGLQRSKTAREAIKVMGALAEKYGYNDYAEGLIIADGNELWYFEVCGAGLWDPESGKPGAMWAAKRVPDDGFIVCANRSRILDIDLDSLKDNGSFLENDTVMCSRNVTELAELMGWWKKGEPFNWSHIYDAPNYGMGEKRFCESRREWRALNLVAPSKNFVTGSGLKTYPFAITPDHKLSVRDLMSIYRDHYEGTPYCTADDISGGAFKCPARWRPLSPKQNPIENRKWAMWERTISVPQCSYSFVGQTRADMPAAIGGCLWFGLASPDTTVYTPVYAGATKLPDNWSHNVRNRFNRECPYWAFNFVQVWSQLRWCDMYPVVQAKQKEIEDGYFAAQAKFEKKALAAYAEDPAKAKEMVTTYCNDNMNKLQKDWWNFADELITRFGFMPFVYDVEADKLTQPGYPADWLQAVDFGHAAEHDYLNHQ